jgi:hypothetical protein
MLASPGMLRFGTEISMYNCVYYDTHCSRMRSLEHSRGTQIQNPLHFYPKTRRSVGTDAGNKLGRLLLLGEKLLLIPLLPVGAVAAAIAPDSQRRSTGIRR